MYGASGPNITHAVNPVSKYRKHASKAFQLPLRNDSITCFIVPTLDREVLTVRVSNAQKKTANGTHPRRDAYGLAALPLADSFQNLPRANGLRPNARMIGATCVPPRPRSCIPHVDQVVSCHCARAIPNGRTQNES